MKETGLMFKAPLVRAILSGQKTQTRRIAKTEITMGRDSLIAPRRGRKYADVYLLPERAKEAIAICPYGQPGDRIYVRETFAHHPIFPQLAFRADGEEFEDADGWLWEPKWSPSSRMTKDDARIWLEVTGVRVERLQSISEADCVAEGACGGMGLMTGAAHFRHIWESTGGGWAANPYVWVIDFKRIEREAAQGGQ